MTAPRNLCVTCLTRVGQPRPTVLRAVVCGPCWAAHGGSPDAAEIGPPPDQTAISTDPRDQRHWYQTLQRQDWVQDARAHARRNLLSIARLLALYADFDTFESRPTWAKLVERSGLSERTVARWLQELRVRGWLAHLERGSTPATRPLALAHLHGNRAALYGLRIPLTPDQALARAGALLARQTTAQLQAVDKTDSPPNPVQDLEEEIASGSSRARKPVDNSPTQASDQGKPQTTALRAGSETSKAPDFSIMVPRTRYAMLVAAEHLRRHIPLFRRCSRKLIRHLCKPYWEAGWCNRDIVYALDHRPNQFSTLYAPAHPAAPAQLIRSRLAAWRAENGTILPGYWTTRATTSTHTARQLIRQRHGHAGARLLRAGETTLTAAHIAQHGRAMRVRETTPTPPRPHIDHTAEHRARLLAQARAHLAHHTAEHRARLLAQARAHLAHHTPEKPAAPPVSGASAYERALNRARTEHPRRSRRRPSR